MEHLKGFAWSIVRYFITAFIATYVCVSIFYYMAYGEFPPRFHRLHSMVSDAKKAQQNANATLVEAGSTPEETVKKLQQQAQKNGMGDVDLTQIATSQKVVEKVVALPPAKWRDQLSDDIANLRVQVESQKFQIKTLEGQVKELQRDLLIYRGAAIQRSAASANHRDPKK